MELTLPASHYREAIYHESCLASCLIVDRRLVRLIKIDPRDCCVDLLWTELLCRLIDDPFIPLEDLLQDTEAAAARTVSDSIRDRVSSAPKAFLWNVLWHEAEIVRLHKLRLKFLECSDFVLEYGDL